MVTVFEVNPRILITKVAEKLQKDKSLETPEWANFVKTGAHKERQPYDTNWWQIRAAALLRTIYIKGPIGTNKLRVKYGGRKSNGVRKDKTVKASGSVIRKCLQQLQAAGLIEEKAQGVAKGRVITGKGRSLLDNTAHEIGPSPLITSEITKSATAASKKEDKKPAKKTAAKADAAAADKAQTQKEE